MLRDCHFMSIADRSLLACWGVRGGRAGRPFSVVVDPGGPNERVVDALADAEPVRAGEVIRIRTTGGGGWGDPLERPHDEVLTDVRWGKVSVDGAWDDYGVRIVNGAVVGAESDAERERRRALRDGTEPFFDRGPGYPALAGGATHAEVDLL
jgi:N-methylhydantoinase B